MPMSGSGGFSLTSLFNLGSLLGGSSSGSASASASSSSSDLSLDDFEDSSEPGVSVSDGTE